MQLYHSFTSTQLTASINAPIAPITTNNISILILCISHPVIGAIIPSPSTPQIANPLACELSRVN